MLGILIPRYLTAKLGAELSVDDLVVDVELRDGRILTALVVKDGCCITGRRDGPSDAFSLLFASEDIADVRLHAFVYAHR
ncbi:hypothetical protein GTP46_18670 [Duganella sp. FT135W]|uniref:Uncharacterized protein n=1 Tax=Duganella flavida TaxID=2692175 RepID=A0A6L8KFV2_9BURK|nr:hypothetical protein [Duganella flavida]MYM24664.1 hypothetical protein [Duganella flavida]